MTIPGQPGGMKGQGGGFHPYKIIMALGGVKGPLTGQQMALLARAKAATEIRPVIHAGLQTAKQLNRTNAQEQAGFGKLGERLQGGVSDVYHGIAQSEAQNLATQGALAARLNQTSGQIAQQSQAATGQMQENQMGAQSAALNLRGAPPTSATSELAQAVAAQKAAAGADSGAAQQFANAQGGNYTGLASAMAGSAAMQGGEASSGIAHSILTRDAAANQKNQLAVQEALGKVNEAKGLKGATIAKDFGEILEGNRKFQLGQEAVAGNKAKLSAEEKQNEAANKIAATSAHASLITAMADQYKAHHPGASSGELAKVTKQREGEVANVRNVIGQLVSEAKAAEKGGEKGIANNFGAYLAGAHKILSTGEANSTVIRKVLKQWWKNRPSPGKDVNGPSLGR